MSNWIDKYIFKKCIVYQTKDSNINIPQITHSTNWDTNKLIFLSSISELKVIEGISISKVEKKINELEYNVGYVKYNYELVSRDTNIPLFDNKIIITDSLYSIIWVKCAIYGNSSLNFKMYRNGVYIKDFTYKWTPVGHPNNWDMTFPIILNHSNIKYQEYTFSLISSNIIGTPTVAHIKNYSVKTSYINNLKTGIIFGEINT